MHTHTIQTKFTFGDRVQFDSPFQRASGSGTIVGITLGPENQIDYLIQAMGFSRVASKSTRSR